VEPREGFVDHDGTRTHYWDVGEGRPVLLLHGSGPGVSALANWRLAIPALSQRRRVVAPDLVGFGTTETDGPIRTHLDTWVSQVASFLKALDLPTVDVVGNSMGGAVGLGLAARGQELVRRVVAMGTVGVRFELTDGLDRAWGYRPSLAAMQELIGLFAHDARFAADEDLVRMRHDASREPKAGERFASLFPAPRQRWIDALALSPEDIERVQHPVLLVHGREDRIIPWESTSLRLLDLLPNARLLLFARCGHWVQIERADEFHRLVDDFLE
jgi:2-hydroxymuconate-semialdehyde hydrolase